MIGLIFFAETDKGLLNAILEGELDLVSEPWPSISDSAKDLVKKMLTPDPKKRITSKQVLGTRLLFLIWLNPRITSIVVVLLLIKLKHYCYLYKITNFIYLFIYFSNVARFSILYVFYSPKYCSTYWVCLL